MARQQPADILRRLANGFGLLRSASSGKNQAATLLTATTLDRRRFEHLWGWAYRFEACTPPPRRPFGYCAMPLLWSDKVIGWANVTLVAGKLHVVTGYVRRCPQTREFQRALDAELARMERFLTNRPNAA